MPISRKSLTKIGALGVAAAAVLTVTNLSMASAASVMPAPNGIWSPWKSCNDGTSNNCASVRTIARTSGGTVFIGGDFSQLRNGSQTMTANNLAALDDSGTPVPSFQLHSFNGTVFTLATDDTNLYVGGAFSKIGASGATPTTGALHLVKLNATTGVRDSAFKSAINNPASTSGVSVYASVLANGKLYLGGKFAQVQGLTRTNLAAVDPATGTVDATWTPTATLNANDPSPNNAAHNNIPVRTLSASPAGSAESRIYVGGDLDNIDGLAHPAAVAVDPTTGAYLTSFLSTKSSGGLNKSFQVMSMVPVDATEGRTSAGVIVAAGGLTNKAWKLNLDGSVAWAVNTDGDVQAAAVLGTSVYFGGHFTCTSTISCYNTSTTDDTAHVHLAAFNYNATSNPVADAAFTADMTPTFEPYYYGVWVLKAYGSSLYAGGVFKNVVVDGTSYDNAKYVRFGSYVAPPTTTPTGTPTSTPTSTPAGNTVFSDDFSTTPDPQWAVCGQGMTIANGVASGAAAGKLACLQANLASTQTSVDYSAQVNVTSATAAKTVILRLTYPVSGSAPKGIVNLFVKPDGTLGLRNEVTSVDWANTSKLTLGVPHTVDLKLTVAGATSTIAVSVDGTAVPALSKTGNFGTNAVGGLQIGDTGNKDYTISWDNVVLSSLS